MNQNDEDQDDALSSHLITETRRVLVVDDDPDLCDFVRQVLKGANYQVEIASDGAAALAALARQAPDALLLDIMMPRLSGDEVLDLLSKLTHRPPIILMTAASRARDLALAHRNPYYLPKPFDATLLLATLETALDEGGEDTEE